MGFLALSYDFGRAATVQSELQSFTDNVALAAAGELNSQADSITRATRAAQTMISDTQTFGDGDQILSDDGDFELTFYSSPPTPTSSGIVTTDAIDAGYVEVTSTQQNVAAVFGNAFTALTDVEMGDTDVGAVAVAGYTQYACDISPMMFCAPSSDWRADENAGITVLLRTGGNGAAWGPGSFGWLDPSEGLYVDEDGACGGMTGQDLNSCLVAAVGNRTTCFSQAGVAVQSGQHSGQYEVYLNMIFDVYHGNAGNNDDNPLYPPAPNVLHSWEIPNKGCVGNREDLSTTKMGPPPDDCHATGTCDRFGDGDWSNGRQAYIDINYGGVDPFPSAVTRYDYYLAEIDAYGSLNPNQAPEGMLPQCSNQTSSDPNRRVMVAASIDCSTGALEADGFVTPIEFVEIFLTAPIGLDGSKDFWVEIIGSIGGGAGGSDKDARFREVVQLYR